jgi:hypothetical protein
MPGDDEYNFKLFDDPLSCDAVAARNYFNKDGGPNDLYIYQWLIIKPLQRS